VQALQGRQRVLAIARNHIRTPNGSGAILNITEKWAQKFIGTVQMPAVASGGNWTLLDCGEYQVDSQPSGGLGFAVQNLQFNLVSASGASAIASPGLDVSAVILLPLNLAAGVWALGSMPFSNGGGYWIRSYPQRDVVEVGAQGGAEQVSMLGQYKGNTPRLPVTGTSMPSGAAQVILVPTRNPAVLGNFRTGVQLTALERFTFQR
jgi:hypothetical protein